MSASLPGLFQLLSARAGFLQARHAVLSQNVANADTPRYPPKDLVAPDFKSLLRGGRPGAPSVALAQTQGGHQAGLPAAKPGARGERHEPFEIAPAGNAVVIEEQIRRMGEAERGYQLATSVYGKYVGMLRTAIGVGG